MTRFYLGSDGLWKHKGWTPVAPGDSPLDPTVPGTDTGGGAGGGGGRVLRFYTTDVVSNGVNLGGGGGGGATGATYFGAEPNPAGNSTTSQQGLINKWGGRPASRHYFGANSTGLPVHIAGISVAQWSWSWGSLDAQVVAGNHDAYFASCAAAMKNGDIATYAHESDNKGLTGTALSNRIGAMNRFYDVFKNTKPGVFISPTHTGYMFSPKNPSGAALRTTWGAVKGDLIGLDLDGVHIDNGNYPGRHRLHRHRLPRAHHRREELHHGEQGPRLHRVDGPRDDDVADHLIRPDRFEAGRVVPEEPDVHEERRRLRRPRLGLPAATRTSAASRPPPST
jgi:hypothetical protein